MTEVSQTKAGAQEPGSQTDADGGAAQDPSSQTPGKETEPKTVEQLTSELATLDGKFVEYQKMKDAEVATAHQQRDEVVRRNLREKANVTEAELETAEADEVELARNDPVAYAEKKLAEKSDKKIHDDAQIEIGKAIMDQAWANPVYAKIPQPRKQNIADTVLGRGGVALDVVNAFAAELEQMAEQANPSAQIQRDMESLQARLDALDNGATGAAIDGSDSEENKPPPRSSDGSFDLGTISGIHDARRAGKMTDDEARAKIASFSA